MSVIVSTWVLEECEESVPGRRLVLLVLADKADADGSGAYPSVARIAHETRLSERGVRYALRELEKAGHIERRGIHPMYGTYEYAVLMRGRNSVQGGNDAQEGGQTPTGSQLDIAPEPSRQPSTNRPAAATRASSDEWPDGIFEGTGEAVFSVLVALGQQHGAKVFTKRQIGHAMLSAPGRDYLSEAHKVASHGWTRQIKDVVATYRRWLGNADQHYSNGSAPRPQLALAPAGRQPTEAQLYRERQARRAAIASGEVPA